MSTHPSDAWWQDSLKGTVTQYVLARPRHKTHVMKLSINGPGALDRRALCGSLTPTLLVNSQLDLSDENECRTWLNGYHGVLAAAGASPGQSLLDDADKFSLQTLCTRCEERYTKAEAKR